MRVLLLGERGQLGHELRGPLATFSELISVARDQVDLSNEGAVREAIASARPDVIINATAYTDEDRAERDEEVAYHINAQMVAVLGEEARRRGAALVHFSTDFVFDGQKGAAYVEDDEPTPLGAYARTKLAGERLLREQDAPAVVFRTSWVYSLRRKSFVTTMLRLARERQELQVVTDQVGSPTFCRDLAQATALVLYGLRGPHVAGRLRELRGLYHLAGAGSVSRFEWARAIFELDPRRSEHKLERVLPILAEAFPLPAKRPLSTPLNSNKAQATFGVALPDWRDALARALGDGQAGA
jgi:dTDP-4-dehydrorhamnose reductase